MERLVEGLLLVVAIWLAIFIAAIIAAVGFKGWLARIAVLLAALVSVPAYFAVQIALDESRVRKHAEAVTEAAQQKESDAWARLCAQPQELKVNASVAKGQAVDLLVRQPWRLFQLNPHLPEPAAATVCWMEAPATRCAQPNIANVQTEGLHRMPSCDAADTGRKGKDCYTRWNFSIAGQASKDVPAEPRPRYVLEVHEGRLSTLIERFRVTVVDDRFGATMAETFIHRKSWLGADGRSPAGEKEARYCPDRDRAIGKMLEAVFPGGAR